MAEKEEKDTSLRAKEEGDISRRLSETLSSFQNSMERMMEDFNRSLFPSSSTSPSSYLGPRQPFSDLIDRGDEFIVEMDAPGVDKDDVDIEISENTLTISGDTEEEKEERGEEGRYLHRERSRSSIFRRFNLPDRIKPSESDASMGHGVLVVKMPKQNPTKSEVNRLKPR